MLYIPDSLEKEIEKACNKERIETLEEIKIMLDKLRFFSIEDYKDAVNRVNEKINDARK